MSVTQPMRAASNHAPTAEPTLADLSAAVRELAEPRQHTEMIEVAVRETTTTSRRKKAKQTRQRRPHTITLPSLLDELRTAAIPGAAGDTSGGKGSFESRPSAELEPIAVLREITDDATAIAREYGIYKPTLAATLFAIVSAPMTGPEIRHVVRQAERWVRRARIATGFDKPPLTLNSPCPYCFRRHALVVTGDLDRAKCTRCGTTWTHDTIGLLADMLNASAEVETLPLYRCWWPQCTRTGSHDEHGDSNGRTWRDVCELPVSDDTPDQVVDSA